MMSGATTEWLPLFGVLWQVVQVPIYDPERCAINCYCAIADEQSESRVDPASSLSDWHWN